MPTIKSSPVSFGNYVTVDTVTRTTGSDDTTSHFESRGSSDRADTFSGDVNPSWRSQVANGQDATTSAYGVKYSVEDGNGRFSVVTDVDFIREFDGFVQGGSYVNARGVYGLQYPNGLDTPSSDVVAETRNRCIRKFLDQAKSVRSSFEAGQDLGEIKQTIEGIIHPMNSLKQLTLGYFSKLKKAKGKYKRDQIGLRKALSDSYLEYRFGWFPLAQDIAAGYSGLTNRIRVRNTQKVTASATGTYNGVPEDFYSGTGGLPYIVSARLLSFSTYSVRFKGAIRLNLAPDGRIPLLQALQLSTLNDFAVTAWDLLPYSFVIDYFLNIGEVINAVTFPSSDFTYLLETVRNKTTFKYAVFDNGLPLESSGVVQKIRNVSGGNTTLTATEFTRGRLQTIDLLPTVRFNLPVSSRPWENIAALISSNVKSLVPFFH